MIVHGVALFEQVLLGSCEPTLIRNKNRDHYHQIRLEQMHDCLDVRYEFLLPNVENERTNFANPCVCENSLRYTRATYKTY